MMRVTGVGYNVSDGNIMTMPEKEMTGIVRPADHPGAAHVLVKGAACNNASVQVVNVTYEWAADGAADGAEWMGITMVIGRTEHGVTVARLPTEAALLVGAAKVRQTRIHLI